MMVSNGKLVGTGHIGFQGKKITVEILDGLKGLVRFVAQGMHALDENGVGLTGTGMHEGVE